MTITTWDLWLTAELGADDPMGIRAENHVIKVKQEISLLQAQVLNFKFKNEAMHSGQGASLTEY